MDPYVLLYIVVGMVWAVMVIQARRKRHNQGEWQQRWAPLVGTEAAKALYQESAVRRIGVYSGAAMFVTIVIGVASHASGIGHVLFALMLCATFAAMSAASLIAPKKRKQACAYASAVLRVKVHPSTFPPSDPEKFAAWCTRHNAYHPSAPVQVGATGAGASGSYAGPVPQECSPEWPTHSVFGPGAAADAEQKDRVARGRALMKQGRMSSAGGLVAVVAVLAASGHWTLAVVAGAMMAALWGAVELWVRKVLRTGHNDQ